MFFWVKNRLPLTIFWSEIVIVIHRGAQQNNCIQHWDSDRTYFNLVSILSKQNDSVFLDKIRPHMCMPQIREDSRLQPWRGLTCLVLSAQIYQIQSLRQIFVVVSVCFWSVLTHLVMIKLQSNLVIRNFLVTLKLFLNAKCSLSL